MHKSRLKTNVSMCGSACSWFTKPIVRVVGFPTRNRVLFLEVGNHMYRYGAREERNFPTPLFHIAAHVFQWNHTHATTYRR